MNPIDDKLMVARRMMRAVLRHGDPVLENLDVASTLYTVAKLYSEIDEALTRAEGVEDLPAVWRLWHEEK